MGRTRLSALRWFHSLFIATQGLSANPIPPSLPCAVAISISLGSCSDGDDPA